MNKTEKLLPCPFCGQQPTEYAIEPHTHALQFSGGKMPDHQGSHVIECACGCGIIDATREEVFSVWNRRPTPCLHQIQEPAPVLAAPMQCVECQSCGSAFDVDSYLAGYTDGKGHCPNCPGIYHSTPQAAPAAVAVPDERDAFERAYSAHAIEYAGIYDPQQDVQQRLKDGRDGDRYKHLHDSGAWVGWKLARAALAATPEAVPAGREDFAWLVVQEACETEPADEDDPDCIRILRRDLKTAVLAAFLRGDTNPAAAAPVVLPEPDAVVKGKLGEICSFFSASIKKGDKLFTEQQVRDLLATGGQVREELPQAEGADYFVILDPEDGTVEFAYSADLGRDFGHEHIKDAQERDNESAHCWVVRPAYAAPQQADARDAEQERWMEIGKAIERACIDQPDSTEIVISLERDAGTVTMFDPDGNEHDQFSHEDGFAGVVNAAIEAAIAAAKGEQQ